MTKQFKSAKRGLADLMLLLSRLMGDLLVFKIFENAIKKAMDSLSRQKVGLLFIICSQLLFLAMMKTNRPYLANPVDVISEILKDDGTFPNNEKLPLLIYKKAIELDEKDPAASVEKYFHTNHWGGSWRNGIYGFHHYHSTAHEALGIYSGSVKVQFGGPEGIIADAKAGDVIIIPAGVAHKNLRSSADFGVVGAYPKDQRWDMNYGKDGERPEADENIKKVPLPETDPVYGNPGPLIQHWKSP